MSSLRWRTRTRGSGRRCSCGGTASIDHPLRYDGAIVTGVVGNGKLPAAGGDTITITGENFGNDGNFQTKVTFVENFNGQRV